MLLFTLAAAAMPNGWILKTEQFSLGPGLFKTVVAECPPGRSVSGGGYQAGDGGASVRVAASFPNPNAASWAVTVLNGGRQPKTIEVTAFAHCDTTALPPPPPPAP